MRAPRLPRPTCAVLAGVLLAWAWIPVLAPPAHANVSVIPYRAADWRYHVYPGSPPSGWQEPGFDDSGFAVGCAAFGTQGDCYIAPCTDWPLGTRVVLRKTFDLPANTLLLTVGAAFDNRIDVYVNGSLVGARGETSEECAGYNRAIFNVHASLLQPTGNVIAVLGTDFGVHNLLDLSVEAVLSTPPEPPTPGVPGPITSCSASDALADAVILTWNDVDNEVGYRIFRDGVLLDRTGLGVTTYTDHPPIGTHGYCVDAYNEVGTTEQCCDLGTRLAAPIPSPCGASDGSSRQVLVTWTDVAGADGYRVYRDGFGIYVAGPDETYYVDEPAAGTYTYCVRAFNAGGESPGCCDSGTRLPLRAPSPCAASDDDPAQILLTWTDVDGEDGYRIYRFGILIHTTGPDETSFADAPPVGTYNYCVRAFSTAGYSADCCNTGTRPALPGPTSCQASEGDVAGITFSWSRVTGAEGYRILRDAVLIHGAGPDETSYFDVPEPGTHTYCVEAFYANGNSPHCCDTGWRPPLPPPGPCSASDDAIAAVTLSWTGVPGADGYRVYRNGVLVFTAAAGVTSYVDAPVVGTYTYCVEAFNALGNSVRCCDSGTAFPLPAPGPCAASDDSYTGVTVTWTPVAGADGHRVYRGAARIATVGALATSYMDVIGPGTYAYGVEAFDASGSSARCTESGTRLALLAPSPCGASDTDPDGVTVTWTAVAGATGYRILRDGAVVRTATPNETSYRDVPPPGTYTYCVRAQDSFGLYPECCDSGTRPALPTVGWCRASDADATGILFEWEDVVGETGYRIYRDDALLQTLGPDQSSYRDVPGPGDYRYCVEPVLAAGSSPRCCDGGRQPSLPAPAACSASQDSREGVTLTWAAVAGAEGYRVLRDGAPVVTVGPEAASYLDTPSAGTYSYCVEAFDGRGTSPPCCQIGTRLGLPAPGPCAAGDTDEGGVDVSWTAVAGAEGYRVFRDGVLAQTTGAGETTYRDIPAPGTYSYCVEAFASWSVSPRCCDSGTRAGAVVPFACAASDTGTVGVLVTWGDVPGEDGYRVLRDGALVTTAGPGVTSHYDRPPVGTYTYCVEAFDTGGALAFCCDPGTRRGEPVPGTASVRVSWNSCSPQVSDTYFSGPGTYKLVLSATGLAQPMIGHDSSLLFGFGLADAWRFDDAGCQTGSQWSASATAFSKSCPALLGTAPLPIVFFGYAPATQCGELRLAVAFDAITPVATTRYTLWQVTFDHTYSVVGPSTPEGACGGADRGITIDPQFALIACSSGQLLALQPTPGDTRVTWQGGAPVRTVPVTWGKLKGLYR